MSMPLARTRRESGTVITSGAEFSLPEYPIYHRLHGMHLCSLLTVVARTAVAPEIPAGVRILDGRCRLGIQNYNAVARRPTIISGVPDEVVVDACYVLLAAVERHVQAALLDGAACRDVSITGASQTDRPLARVEELRLIKG